MIPLRLMLVSSLFESVIDDKSHNTKRTQACLCRVHVETAAVLRKQRIDGKRRSGNGGRGGSNGKLGGGGGGGGG